MRPLAIDACLRSFQRTGIFALFIAFYIMLGSYALITQAVTSGFGDLDMRFSTTRMTTGTADRPFVYRMLIPHITFFLADHTPIEARKTIADLTRHCGVVGLLKDVTSLEMHSVLKNDGVLYIYFWQYVVLAACLAGLVFSQYKLAQQLYPAQQAIALFAPLGALLMIPAFKWPQLMVYDIPVVFFGSLCCWMMVGQHWKRYLICLALALCNKESAAFIMFLFVVFYARRLPSRIFYMLLAAQVAIYAAVRIMLNFLYINNPGNEFEPHFAIHLARWIDMRSYYNGLDFMLIVITIFLLVFDWNKKPEFLRASLVLLPLLFACYLKYGFPGEYRAFTMDLIPTVSLLFTDTLFRATGVVQWLDRHLAKAKEITWTPIC